jgi:hypothetical protein
MIALDNIVEMPAFHFNNYYTEIGCDYDKIRMTVVDVRFIVDEIVVRKFL